MSAKISANKISDTDIKLLRESYLKSQDAAIEAQHLANRHSLLSQKMNIKYKVGGGSIDISTGKILSAKEVQQAQQ